MTDNKIISSSQNGFNKGNSCLTNLMNCYDEKTGPVDKGKAVHIIYLDFSKAFDTVTNKILIDKVLMRTRAG